MPVIFVQKSKGGILRNEVVEGAPSRWDADPAPTVTLYDPNGNVLVASQSATLGPSTTLDGAAAANQTTVPLTATTSLSVAGQYVIGPNATGQWEWITIDSITSGASITVRDPLVYTYASGDAFKSHEMTVTVAATDITATYTNCRAEWSYEISNVPQVDTTIFHSSAWNPRLTLTDQDVMRRNPRAKDLLGTRQRLGDLIKDVWERDVLEELAVVVDPGMLLSGEALSQATLYRVLAEIAGMGEDYEERDRLMEQYRATWERVITHTPIDADGSGNITDNDIVRTSMTGRIVRV